MEVKELEAMDHEALVGLGFEALEAEITHVQHLRELLFELALRLTKARDVLAVQRDARLKLARMTPAERAAAAVILAPVGIDGSKVN